MNTKILLLSTFFFCTQLIFPWIDSLVANLDAYISPGTFYEQGELSVTLTTIPETTAPVELDVYTPSSPDIYPVIIFQHGFSGSIKGYEAISTQLASHGFVVVLPQMYPPGDFGAAPTPEEEAALGVEIISWIETNINTYIPVTGDTSLLGLAGHSRGGQTAYRMALLVPEKVKALSGVDPVDGLELFGQTLAITGPLTFDIPTYILGTGLGPIVVDNFLACAPEEVGPVHFYCANPDPTWLVVATTHGHADMIDEEDFTEFCPGGPDRQGMRALTGGTLAAFFSGTLQGNESALMVLSDPGSAPVPVTMEKNKQGTACPNAIPTLSEWGMIILSLLIITVGMVAIRCRYAKVTVR
jgi:chlorophyllase